MPSGAPNLTPIDLSASEALANDDLGPGISSAGSKARGLSEPEQTRIAPISSADFRVCLSRTPTTDTRDCCFSSEQHPAPHHAGFRFRPPAATPLAPTRPGRGD